MLRLAICVHLLFVAISIVVSRIDTGLLELSRPVELFFFLMMFPCLLAMFLCPAFVVLFAFRSPVTLIRRALALSIDFAISVVHFFAFVPLVQ